MKIIKKLRSIKEDLIKSEHLDKDAQDYWSASNHDKTTQDMSHWRGAGRFTEEEWLKIGVKHFTMYKTLIEKNQQTMPFQPSILEWGGGGGANAWKFCEQMQASYYDVDISQANLQEAKRQIDTLQKGKLIPILLEDPSNFAPVENLLIEFDLVLSTAVFQHFPSKEYGIKVLETMMTLLKKGGFFIIQIRYDDGRERFKPKDRNYEKNVVFFTSYTMSEFELLLDSQHLIVQDKYVMEDYNYCYYLGYKK